MRDLTATSNNYGIFLTWTEPDPIPSNGYRVKRECRRLCLTTFRNPITRNSSSSPLVLGPIKPGTYCNIIAFTGKFGTDTIEFDSEIVAITLSVSEFDKLHYEFYNSIVIFSLRTYLFSREHCFLIS